ncbi:MAG: hypothetical protein AAF393_13465 [Pseudomonadota bacterium]
MPTASFEMIEKLSADGASTKTKLAKLAAHVKKHPGSPNAGKINEAIKAFTRMHPQVEKFQRDADRKPPILADETKYKTCRKLMTGVMKVAEATAKKVSKEAIEENDDITVQAYTAARSELTGTDAKLAQALTMVATGVKGRTGPKESGVPKYNHIHIGGNAKNNLLFQPDKGIVLGTIPFHIDKKNNDQQKAQVKAVASRSGGKVTLTVTGNKIKA